MITGDAKDIALSIATKLNIFRPTDSMLSGEYWVLRDREGRNLAPKSSKWYDF